MTVVARKIERAINTALVPEELANTPAPAGKIN